MKDWNTLEPDRVKLLNKHFTRGRGGHKIDMVVIHHNAGVLSIDQIWQVWQDRAASAHYQVTTTGEIGQLVWDRDTAWHAANSNINARSIGLEFSNSAGAAQDWPITDKTIEEGAHLVAAVCRYYKLGRPQVGKNVRFHRDFTSTSCPYHLAPGGKYHDTLMTRAKYWYDNPTGTANPPATTEKEPNDMTPEQNAMLTRIHHELTHKFDSRFDLAALERGEISEDKVFKDTLIGYVLENNRAGELTRRRVDKLEKRLADVLDSRES